MNYTKQNFKDGDILTANNLNRIEDGIIDTNEYIDGKIDEVKVSIDKLETSIGDIIGTESSDGYVNTLINELGRAVSIDGKQIVTTGINHSIKKPTQPTSELIYEQKEDGTYKCTGALDSFEGDTILVADWYNDNYVTEIDAIFNQAVFIPSHVTKANIYNPIAVIFDEGSRLADFTVTNAQFETFVLPASIKNVKDNMFLNRVPTTLVFKGTPDTIGASLSNSERCNDIYVPWLETDLININAPWGFTEATIHYNFPVEVFNMDGSWKTLDDYIDNYTNGNTAKVIKNMKRIDEEGLAKGWYDATALEKFQNNFNRVYVEQSKNRGIYAKVALTSSGKLSAQPTDYDIDDQEIPYYLGSIPTRLNGSKQDPDFNGADTLYRVGHIKVPPIDVDNFPTADEADEFAISKLYVDSAIDKKIEENNNFENVYYTPNIDDYCIAVTRDGTVDDKTTEVYINNNYKIDTTTDNYFKFKSNFKWNTTNNAGELYLCIRDSKGLKGYIYLQPSANTIKTNGNINTGLALNSIIPQNETVKLSIFGKLGGMSYLQINDVIYELNEKAFSIPAADDIIYFTISLSKTFNGGASISEVGYILGTDASINSASYKVEKIDISEYPRDLAIPNDKNSRIYSTHTNYPWITRVRDDNNTVVANKRYVIDTLANSLALSPLAGKKIIYHGDSICESRTDTSKANYNGGGYAKIIADITGSVYENYAGSGSVLVSALPSGQSLSPTAKYIVTDMDNMTDDADIICFQGGINDWFKDCPLGELSDIDDYSGVLNTTEVIGALESICRKAINKWSDKHICFIITHKIANNNAAYAKNYEGEGSWSYKELHDVMIQIFNKYSIPYLDMFNEGGLNSYMDIHNTMYFTGGSTEEPDKTHPNELAYRKYYVPKLIKLFESLI